MELGNKNGVTKKTSLSYSVAAFDVQGHPNGVKSRIWRALLLFRRMLSIHECQAFSSLGQGNFYCVCRKDIGEGAETSLEGQWEVDETRVKSGWATSKISVNHLESACRSPDVSFHPLPLSLVHVASSVYGLNPTKLLVRFLLISPYIYRNSSQSIYIPWEMLFLKIFKAPAAFLWRNSVTLYHQIS